MAAGDDIEEMVQVQKAKRRLVVGLAVVAAFAFSGMALAAAEGEDDTVLNYGYDEDSHFFMWNVTSLDWEPDEELLQQLLDEDENLAEDDELGLLLAACGLAAPEGADEIVYTYEVDEDGNITLFLDDQEVDLSNCGELAGGDVTGPAGQVNHGMFLKFFNENYEGENRGCIVSQIARSGLGKHDQQVKAGEPDSGTEEVLEDEEPTITFTTVTTDCQHGDDDDEGEREGNGPPQHVLDKFGGKHPRDAKGPPTDGPGGRP